MRIMGLDFGSKTVGVAVSDSLLITAQGVEIVRRKYEDKLRQTLARIEELIQEYEVDKIVLGLPKNMNNSIGPRAEASMAYGKLLEDEFGLPVNYQDERLTTVQAERMLVEQANTSRAKRKKVIDKVAAVMILQNYLDKKM